MESRRLRWRLGWQVVALVIAAGAGPAAAVNKCVGNNGAVTYTDGPCPGGSAVSRLDTPPPLSAREEADARRRSEAVVQDARALEARQSAERLAQIRLREAEQRAAEATAQQQARQQTLAEENTRWVVTQPVIRRYVPPAQVVPPRPKPTETERPRLMRAYPFN